MLSWVFKFLTSGVLDKLLDYYSQREDSKAVIATKEIEAELETRKLRKELLELDYQHWVTRLIIPFIVYPFALHSGAVCLDSVFHFGWNIAKLPPPYDNMQYSILLSYFLAGPITSLGKGILYHLGRK